MNRYETPPKLRVKMMGHGPSVTFGNDIEGLFMRKRLLVRALAPQGVILIADHDNPAFDRNLFAVQLPG